MIMLGGTSESGVRLTFQTLLSEFLSRIKASDMAKISKQLTVHVQLEATFSPTVGCCNELKPFSTSAQVRESYQRLTSKQNLKNGA